MKEALEQLISENRDRLGLTASRKGLCLNWVTPENYSVFFNGAQYTPDEPSDFSNFLNNVLSGQEKTTEDKARERIEKEENKRRKAEEKVEEKTEEKVEEKVEKPAEKEPKLKPVKEKKLGGNKKPKK